MDMLRFLVLVLPVVALVFVCACGRQASKVETHSTAGLKGTNVTIQGNDVTNALKSQFELQTIQSNLMSLRRQETVPVFSNVIRQGFEATAQALSFTNKARESVSTFSGRIYSVIET